MCTTASGNANTRALPATAARSPSAAAGQGLALGSSIRRIRLFPLSTTSSAPVTGSTATPQGELNIALPAAPSAHPSAPAIPARVHTNRAADAAPLPSAPALPVLASTMADGVVVARRPLFSQSGPRPLFGVGAASDGRPVPIQTARTQWLPLSATYRTWPQLDTATDTGSLKRAVCQWPSRYP